VVLDDDGKRRFLQAYQQRMDQTYTHPIKNLKLTLRQCLIEQARQVADALINANPSYMGMGFR
jgi:CRISPR-associated protein Cas1